jgi:lipid A 3-O-deacylase
MAFPMRVLAAILILFSAAIYGTEKPPSPQKTLPPSHLMVGPGIFDVDQDHPRALIQVEYRWEINCHHWRPLAAFFITTDRSFYVCGGMSYDIFLGKKVVLTPSFSPGLYYHGDGKRLGFPLNFRSAMDLSYVLPNQGRLTVQFNHISNARMLWKNPGADSLIFFYAIPIPCKQKGK